MEINPINIDDIIISKPKKSENSFVCSVYYKSKSEKPTFLLNNILVIDTKPLAHRNEFFLYIKNRLYNNFMFDLNKYLIDIIKDKSPLWFNNNLNSDLIDDLYTSTLIYDKVYGDIIRIKCIGDQEKIIDEFKNKNIDLNITLNHIRFYKQKFVLECEINSFEPSQHIFEDIDNHESVILNSEEDLPSPTYEDIKRIKQEKLEIIDQVSEELKDNLRILEQKILIIETLRSDLLKTMNIENIATICNDLEKLWD